MSKQIVYTDFTIKSYTEDWAVKRLDKKRYIVKNGLIWTVVPLISTYITHYKEGIYTDRFFLEAVTLALLAFGFAYWSYNSREKAYRKFLQYQADRQMEEPRPGKYYN